MSEQAEYSLRPYKDLDIPFIQSSWGSSYYKGARYKQYLSPQAFHKHHRPIREAFFQRPTATAIIACASNNEDLILGWVALEEIKETQSIILHYLYVKEAFKGLKVSTRLLEALKSKTRVLFTHQTDKARQIIKANPDAYQHFWYAPHLT